MNNISEQLQTILLIKQNIKNVIATKKDQNNQLIKIDQNTLFSEYSNKINQINDHYVQTKYIVKNVDGNWYDESNNLVSVFDVLQSKDMCISFSKSNQITSFQSFFRSFPIRFIPNDVIDFSNGTNFYRCFESCTYLTTIPLIDTSKGTNFSRMFFGDFALTSVPLIDTSNGTDFSYMFYNCAHANFRTIPLLNLSKANTVAQMFMYCYNFETLPEGLNTSNVTNFTYFLFYCSNRLKSVPYFDTSKATVMHGMFGFCRQLINIPDLNTSNVTNFYGMFSCSDKLVTAPSMDTSNGINFNRMFGRWGAGYEFGCTSLKTIPRLNLTKAVYTDDMFYGCKNLQTIGIQGTINVQLDLSDCTKLTHETLVSILNALVDLSNKPSKKLNIGNQNIAKLTEQQIQIATSKNWIIL